jgi:hypothetical protein
MYFQLQVSTLPTEGTEYGLLLTPLAQAREQKSFDKYDQRMERLVEKGHKPFTMPLDQMALRGLLPTPQDSDFVSTVRDNDYSLRHLEHQSGWVNKMLPTPNAFDWNTAQKVEKYEERKQMQSEKGINLQLSLPQAIVNQLLPTPVVSDKNAGRRGNAPRAGHNPMTNSLKDAMNYQEQTSKCSHLSPQFVLEMMGFPTDWTELPFLNGEKKL